MGKVNRNDKESKTPKQRNNKYLRPGALAQLRYSKVSSDMGKKRVLVSDEKNGNDLVIHDKLKVIPIKECPSMLSPDRFKFSSVHGVHNVVKLNEQLSTPKTPRECDGDCESESRLESLPMDLVVKILCHLHHDQLRAVFHVSQRIRKAVILAKQFHFNYVTPDRSRQEMLSTITPLATQHRSFIRKRGGRGFHLASPHTPKAPRHGPRPPSRLKFTDMRPVAAALFQEASVPSRCMVPPVLSKPLCKNRILFSEDELCQAVAQNKLL